MNIAADIQFEIQKVAKKLWPKIKLPEIVVAEPPSPPSGGTEFGDYSCPVALGIGRLTKSDPLKIAEQIKEKLGKIEQIKEITVTKPGFINFIINYKDLADDLLARPQKISAMRPRNIILEHTAVNPNKAAHIGHLRNACLGDSYAKILKLLGHNVEIQNYIDDLGTQVADSVMAMREFGAPPKNQPADEWYWNIYSKIQKKYKTEPGLLENRDNILQEMEEGKNADAKKIVDEMVAAHLATFKKFNIKYDLLVFEHDIINNHLWDKVFEDLKKRKLIVKPATGEMKGAWIVEFGETERENKILVRANGVPTYTAKDLAYELWKFGLTEPMKGYKNKFKTVDMTITVIDERQSYPRRVIQHILSELGYKREAKNSIHLAYGVVKISKKAAQVLNQDTGQKSTYSMSGRSGIGVMVNALLDTVIAKQICDHKTEANRAKDIAVGSIRYYMLKTRPLREIIFDFDEALKTDGNTGVYLQYAYVRANHILMKVDSKKSAKIPKNLSVHEKQLIKTLAELESHILKAANEYDPSLICDYAHGLASTFARFYETSPVLQSEEPLKSFRLNLVKKYKETLEQVLNLIGIPVLPSI
ncbi:arginine--tRNA ligase [candidate division Kazan bacterium]|uniref:Arginine--tRNA ligase n=1 Tax=candidate division Kazan bacterium TaxID=2202143 RepID=A0A420ZDA4_UNCK3|nr:MAG: arginine--tRNA ligase [candidate division Kazan bacterium]